MDDLTFFLYSKECGQCHDVSNSCNWMSLFVLFLKRKYERNKGTTLLDLNCNRFENRMVPVTIDRSRAFVLIKSLLVKPRANSAYWVFLVHPAPETK